MEELDLKYQSAKKAFKTLEAILKERYSVIVRDATIQRFEYTFEVFWKLMRSYLREKEGSETNSPKSCFREVFSAGLTTAEDTELLLKMTDSRNKTSHTYDENIAEEIYKDVKIYAPLMKRLLNLLESRL
ncbi:MAG: nucleotidyltransferase substrate binding protein [Chlamydiae bacterium]|nr:nucleotidyltransferase substrate binding protein [Chlamydiota bacterium]MBI3277978.1 nucleotidyltransferase substrate binding protein [Chlamydiota bacterium]